MNKIVYYVSFCYLQTIHNVINKKTSIRNK